MDNLQQQLYLSLNDANIIGPEHHRFKLKGNSAPHPLGQLWQADDLSTSSPTPVSLIVIAPELTKHKGLLAAFKKQIIRAKGLRHKHILSIYGYFVHRGGLLFFAFEALDGLTLANLIHERKISKLKEGQQRGLIHQLASAVDFFHQKTRTPHGAISPDLIYINRQAGVKLFPLDPRELFAETTFQLEPAFLYPAYQAPEAFHPNPLPIVSDIYSVACISYAILTGNPPFTISDDEAARVRKELKAPTQMNKSQWFALQQGLTTTPEQRQPNCATLIEAIFHQAEPTTNQEEPSPADTATAEIANVSPQKSGDKTTLYWLVGSFLFAAGVTVGFFASVLLAEHQRQQLNGHIEQWKNQASMWKATSEDQTNQILQMEAEINQLKEQTLAMSTSFQASGAQQRAPASEPTHFVAFHDPLSIGGFGPDMISLPAGQFQMGDINRQGDDNEKPVITVNVQKPFALSRHEVTFEQYDRFAEATQRKRPNDNGWGRGQLPVVNVSWNDANNYANWLREQTGQPYRLPSEAEWEYAARAGTSSAYWWGNELSSQKAVCDGCGTLWDGEKPAPVGSLLANPWGFNDLNGNVDEWVQDCYTDTLASYPKDGQAYLQAGCEYRAMRGGSWFDIGRVVRSASRYRHPPTSTRNTWGFRVALDLNDKN